MIPQDKLNSEIQDRENKLKKLLTQYNENKKIKDAIHYINKDLRKKIINLKNQITYLKNK